MAQNCTTMRHEHPYALVSQKKKKPYALVWDTHAVRGFLVYIYIMHSWSNILGSGSPPVSNSHVFSCFNIDEGHLADQQSKG